MPASRPVAVLVVGCDSSLRQTYAMMFEQAGYTAEHSDFDGSPRRLKAHNFLLLVVDHTLSQDQRNTLVRVARQLSPGIKVMALHSSGKDCGADLVMDSRRGGDAILAAVAVLLDLRGKAADPSS